MTVASRIRVQTIQTALSKVFHIYCGFSTSAVLCLLPITTIILLTEWEIGTVTGQGWIRLLGKLALLLTIPLIVGLLAVYFLRILYWLKLGIRRYWNTYTPPFEPQSKSLQSSGKKDNKVRTAEKYAALGFIGGFAALIGPIIVLSLIDFLLPSIRFDSQPIAPDFLTMTGRLIELIPILGEAIRFAENLPGDSIFTKIWWNGAAIPFAFALRNFMHIFENPDYVLKNASRDFTNRYTILGIYGATAVIISIVMLFIVATSQLP